ncbi:hypothetical protein DMB66_46165 [Actinoplanes sp. ATCC 53533]|uniref:hypothetical protein n=1 Tax=Actinoplanes sp. ATCC 53533 TaxID=1288362 RepID=UPI000F789090|nr:hypothetical protein [Actinoplanes sp. ATCC 53533]RSM48542.1 hypothetical protein DMB66_46165 [Actinoplanes sp. ATCC 53533]
MERRTAGPRGLVSRALIAAAVFAGAVVPGWTLGDLAEHWTGWGLLDWLITCGWSGLAVFALGPYGSYRRRDVLLGILPLYGWYVASLLSWRVALLPLRDWEPRADELWRARWLTGGLVGYWRADSQTPPAGSGPGAAARPRSGSAPGAGRRTT